MKKTILALCIAFLTLSFMGCVDSEQKKAKAFLDSFGVVDFVNTFEVEDFSYSLWLSAVSPWTYNVMTQEDYHVVTVKQNRAWVYLSDDEHETIRNHRDVFYMNRETLEVYRFDESTCTSDLIDALPMDDIEDLVLFVRDELGKTGRLCLMESLFPMIQQIFSYAKAEDIEVMGSGKSQSVSFSMTMGDFLDSCSRFTSHLHAIYGWDYYQGLYGQERAPSSLYEEVYESMSSSPYPTVSIQIKWNPETEQIYPILWISGMQNKYYVLDPAEDSIDFEVVFPQYYDNDSLEKGENLNVFPQFIMSTNDIAA